MDNPPKAWQDMIGAAFHRAVKGQPNPRTSVNYTQHLHPRVDPKMTTPTETLSPITTTVSSSNEIAEEDVPEYDQHVAILKSKIQYKNSDYNELLQVAKTLESYVESFPERLKLASKLLKDTKSRFMSVDVVGAIDAHINDIEAHHKLAMMDTPKSLVQMRFENLTEEIEKIDQDTQTHIKQIREMEDTIASYKQIIDHNNSVKVQIQADIDEVKHDLKTPLDKAVEDVKSELLNIKSMLTKE
jgi:chromosome segregation ATPase